MARVCRIQGEGYLYHITSRGDDRKKIFTSENDYQKFLEYLLSAKQKYNFYLYAYCLMGNHYHLLIETTQPNISRIMQYINTAYTVYYNTKHKRCGHLFQGRYKSIIVEADNYLLELTRYIHLNPVRAKITDKPEKYRWSSYGEYVGEGRGGIIDKTQAERYFKLTRNEYRKFVLEGIGREGFTNSDLYAGFILGKDKFIGEIVSEIKRQKNSKEFAYKKAINGTNPDSIIKEVAGYYKMDPEILYSCRKRPVLAKKISVYLLKRYTVLTNREIGDKFRISYSGVSWINKDVNGLMEKDRGIKEAIERIISHLKV